MKRNVRKQGLFEKRDHTQSFISIPNTMLETNLKWHAGALHNIYVISPSHTADCFDMWLK